MVNRCFRRSFAILSLSNMLFLLGYPRCPHFLNFSVALYFFFFRRYTQIAIIVTLASVPLSIVSLLTGFPPRTPPTGSNVVLVSLYR